MGRAHRHFFRIVAIDGRQPRDGRELEVLGTYDPRVADTDQRVTLKPDRVKYWIGVGAQVSDKVSILLKKYMKKFEDLEAAKAAAPAAAEPAGTTA
jgi:small subunit ribosomal protein S16